MASTTVRVKNGVSADIKLDDCRTWDGENVTKRDLVIFPDYVAEFAHNFVAGDGASSAGEVFRVTNISDEKELYWVVAWYNNNNNKGTNSQLKVYTEIAEVNSNGINWDVIRQKLKSDNSTNEAVFPYEKELEGRVSLALDNNNNGSPISATLNAAISFLGTRIRVHNNLVNQNGIVLQFPPHVLVDNGPKVSFLTSDVEPDQEGYYQQGGSLRTAAMVFQCAANTTAEGQCSWLLAWDNSFDAATGLSTLKVYGEIVTLRWAENLWDWDEIKIKLSNSTDQHTFEDHGLISNLMLVPSNENSKSTILIAEISFSSSA